MKEHITTTEDLVVFQLVNSVIFLILRQRGYGDEELALILGDSINDLTKDITDTINESLDIQIAKIEDTLPPVDEDWIVDIANRAVQSNLINGQPKYTSAQGYACAVAALKLGLSYRGKDIFSQPVVRPAPNDEGLATNFPPSMVEEVKTRVIQGGVDLFRYHEKRFGREAAAKATLEYLAEKAGIADITALGLSADEIADVKLKIAAAVLGME